MIKEILKGINIIPKKENSKKYSELIQIKNKRINSVLNNFILFKKISLKKKSKKNLLEKANSAKAILNKKNSSSYKKLNTNFKIDTPINQRNMQNKDKNIINNNSYSLKRKTDILREIPNMESFYLGEKINSFENSIEKKSNLKERNYSNILENTTNEFEENGNKSMKRKKLYLKNVKYDNQIFRNNLAKEFEIRCLKIKIKKLKNNMIELEENLNNIKKKNNQLKNKILKGQNERKDIICNTINISNKIFNKNNEEENNFKNLLLNLMDIKINYENLLLRNIFFKGIEKLLTLSNIFNDKINMSNNHINNIYYKIKNLIGIKNKYISDLKENNIQNIKNKKIHKYILYLCKKLNIDNLEQLDNYLKKIKSNNENEMKNIIKMKKVLYDENKLSRKRININSSVSVDNLIKRKNFSINFNYPDLQKYFIENNNKYIFRNNYSAKASNMTIRTDKNNFVGYLTDKNESEGKNYYTKKREKINSQNYRRLKNDLKGIKNNIINIDKIKEKEKENNLLYNSFKEKIRNIPHNNKTFKNMDIKKFNNENSISCNNLGTFNVNKLQKKNINRINIYKLNQLTNNKLNNSINIKLSQVQKLLNKNINNNKNEFSKDIAKTEINSNYINSFKFKKKSLNIKIPSLKMAKNPRNIFYVKK